MTRRGGAFSREPETDSWTTAAHTPNWVSIKKAKGKAAYLDDRAIFSG